MAGRRANGEGTIYRRKDGRYEAAAYFLTASGTRKRVRVYGKTRTNVHEKLIEVTARAFQGVRLPDRAWKLGDYLDYWLEQVVRPNRRLSTYERYELAVRLYLKPGLGRHPLTRISVATVQTFLNQHLSAGHSVRNVQIMREVLSSALTRAYREELITKNVARLVELPTWERRDIKPWTADEAKQFLTAAQGDPLYPAFVLLVLYGLRRGEVLGLRWCDVDLESHVLYIRQQVQRVGGELHQGPVKTRAGRRDLPLLGMVQAALAVQPQACVREGLVFTTRSGQPIEPRNFVRSFQRICTRHDIRIIRVHDVRHTAATLLKNLGVPARDAQLILGHSDISITQQVYQHDDMDGRRDALGRVERLFLRTVGSVVAVRSSRQEQFSLIKLLRFYVAGVAGLEPTTPGFGAQHGTYGQRRLTEVNSALNDCRRRRLIGVAAVSTAVSIEPRTTTPEVTTSTGEAA